VGKNVGQQQPAVGSAPTAAADGFAAGEQASMDQAAHLRCVEAQDGGGLADGDEGIIDHERLAEHGLEVRPVGL
jgi:hypothetical protein